MHQGVETFPQGGPGGIIGDTLGEASVRLHAHHLRAARALAPVDAYGGRLSCARREGSSAGLRWVGTQKVAQWPKREAMPRAPINFRCNATPACTSG